MCSVAENVVSIEYNAVSRVESAFYRRWMPYLISPSPSLSSLTCCMLFKFDQEVGNRKATDAIIACLVYQTCKHQENPLPISQPIVGHIDGLVYQQGTLVWQIAFPDQPLWALQPGQLEVQNSIQQQFDGVLAVQVLQLADALDRSFMYAYQNTDLVLC